MAKKYIEAELLKGCMYTGLTGNDLYKPHGIENFVNDLPAADVVEVVRCADCRFLTFSDMYGECGKGIMGVVNSNDYCSRGERKYG